MKRLIPVSSSKRYLSLVEAAAHSGLSVTTLRRMDRAGCVAFLRPTPRRILVDREALDAYLLASARR
jgi:excisionase family DNA binding protein